MTRMNPIQELNEIVQEDTGELITFEISKDGADHVPTITALLKMPCGKRYTATGKNQKEAKKKACKMALKEY